MTAIPSNSTLFLVKDTKKQTQPDFPNECFRKSKREITMEIYLAVIISLTAYKIASLLVGLLFSFMGYRLFMRGIWGHSGEIDSQFGDTRFIIKKAAPGTFFALFGAIIVIATVSKGLDLKAEIYDLYNFDQKNDLDKESPAQLP
jgi:hypothetical protein